MKKPGLVVRIDGRRSYRPRPVVRLPVPPDPQFSGRPICYVPRGVVPSNNKIFDRRQIVQLRKNVHDLMACHDPRATYQYRKYAEICLAFEARYGERP